MSDTSETRNDELREDYEREHTEHPEVQELFNRITLELIRAGRKHGAANYIAQRMRHESRVGGDGKARFKINNNLIPFYAEAFESAHPEHKGFFRTRARPSKSSPPRGQPDPSPDQLTHECDNPRPPRKRSKA